MKVVHNATQQLSEGEKEFIRFLVRTHIQNTMRKIEENTVAT